MRQAEFAAEAIVATTDPEVATATAQVLIDYPQPRERTALLARIRELRAGKKHDRGGALRAALLAALGPVASQDDVELLETITQEAEKSFQGSGDGLRAAALVALHQVDSDRAAYHAVDLLWEYGKRRPEGKAGSEPALSAVRVLGATGQPLAVYAALVSGLEFPTDVTAECLRALEGAPPWVVERLFGMFTGGRDEFLLLGAVDLIIAHPGSPSLHALFSEFLQLAPPDVFRYAATASVASRRHDLIGLLIAAAEQETRHRRLSVYADAFGLARADERVPPTLVSIRDRLSQPEVQRVERPSGRAAREEPETEDDEDEDGIQEP